MGGIFDNLILETGDATHAGTPYHANTRFVNIFVKQTSVAHSFVHSHKAIDSVAVQQTHLLAVEII